MSGHRTILAFLVGILAFGGTALALSIALPSPDIRFPQGYDQTKADAIEAVLHGKQFKYVDGLYSHWPPAWGTTLVYAGDAQSLSAMLERLAAIPGIHVRVKFSRDLSKESGTGHSAGDWWIQYSHESPDTLTVRINLASRSIDPSELEFKLEGRS